MAGDLVLITGATGHVGFRVLRYALEYGYQVRAAVRSEAKANTLKSNPVLKAMNKESDLSFIIVPDIVAPGAFDEAVKGVKYVLHVASPIPTGEPEDGNYDKAFISPAVQGTIGMLESAKKAGTVKRIVITSSVVALAPPSIFAGPLDEVFTADSRQAEIPAPYPNMAVAYVASKTAALNRAERWLAAEKPGFDVIHVHPAFVFGRDDLALETADFFTGTNLVPLKIALGSPPTNPGTPNSFNNVDDTAWVHVRALDEKLKGNQSFVTSWDDFAWEDTLKIVAKHFPKEVESGIFPNNAAPSTIPIKVDSSKTEEVFGFKHTSYEKTVVGVLEHYLELREKEQTRN